jgi:acetylglutamate kinase
VGGGFAETITKAEAERLIDDGTITGGMALKVRVALEAAASVGEVVIAGKARLTGVFGGTRVGGRVLSEARA